MARIRQPLTYANLVGSQLLAAMINAFFYGIAFLMTLYYFKRYARNDPIYVKAMVGMMILLATLQTIFVNRQTYRDTIIFGNASRSNDIDFTLPGKFACIFITTFIFHVFFAVRIWRLTQNIARQARWALVPLGALAILQFVSGMLLVNLETTSKTYAELGQHAFLNIRATAMQGCAAATADIVITVTLCYLYSAHRTASSKANSTIDLLMKYAINRAAATSICAMLNVFLFYFVSGTYYFTIPAYMTGQLYVISAVSVLISRESLRDEGQETLKPGESATRLEHEKQYSGSEKSV